MKWLLSPNLDKAGKIYLFSTEAKVSSSGQVHLDYLQASHFLSSENDPNSVLGQGLCWCQPGVKEKLAHEISHALTHSESQEP